MKSLLYKDLVNLKQQMRIYALILAVWVVVAVMEKNLSFLGGMLSVLGILVAITAYGYDMKSGWETYALTLPVGRRELVLSKYVLTLLAMAVNMLLYAAVGVVLRAPQEEFLNLMCVFLALGFFATDLVLPLILKFGVEKGRIIMILVFLIPSILSLAVGEIPPQVSAFLETQLFSALVLAASVVLLPVSAAVSIVIYRRKEF